MFRLAGLFSFIKNTIIYSVDHKSAQFHFARAKNADTLVRAIPSYLTGMTQMIPLVGRICSLAEKRHIDSRIDTIRDHYLKSNDSIVESPDFQLQALFFDAAEAPCLPKDAFAPEVQKKLEGSPQSLQISALITHLEKFKENKDGNDPSVDNCINQLNNAKALAINQELMCHAESYHEHAAFQNKWKTLFKSSLEKLHSDNSMTSITIPLVIREGKNDAHAMICKIEKNQDGTYKLLIYNTGDGIQLHKNKENDDNYYHPFCIENIDFDKLNNPTFAENLLDKLDYTKEFVTPEILYAFLKESLGGAEKQEWTSEDVPYRIQRVGSCSKQSLNVWLDGELPPELSKQFHMQRLNDTLKSIYPNNFYKEPTTDSKPLTPNRVYSMQPDVEQAITTAAQEVLIYHRADMTSKIEEEREMRVREAEQDELAKIQEILGLRSHTFVVVH